MYSKDIVIELVKARKDRGGITVPSSQLDYWEKRIEAAAQELSNKGIELTEDISDSVLLADYVVWRLDNRDKPSGTPDWLRLAIRERWLHRGESDATD